MWLVMLLYYFSMYNVSLNIMRQTIAVSFVTLAVTYLFDKQYKPYFVLMVIAFAMHSSAILGFGIFPMYLFYKINLAQVKKAVSQRNVCSCSCWCDISNN